MSLSIKLLIVDDHQLFRRGLVALLAQDARFAVAGEACDAGMALHLATKLQPDVVLLDNHLPGVRGIEAIQDLKAAVPGARILMLTVSENEADLAAALRAGAEGYLLKTINMEDLSDSILKVWNGDAVVSPEMMGKLVGLLREPPVAAPAAAPAMPVAANGDDRIHSLSPREREILTRIARGASNKVIGRDLSIAETTVKIHVQHILRKLDLNNRVHAAVYASERGLS